jgi:Uncharacterized protein involved in propionate catabolism
MMDERSDDSVSKGTAALVGYIRSALDKQPPAEVIEKARLHTLDTIAAMVSGARLRAGMLATEYVRQMKGSPLCTVVASDFLTTPVDAALANGIMAHADETDDSHLGGRFHPGCGIVPAALAAAEISRQSGMNLLKAVALGYDIGARFNLSLGPRKLYSGGHSTHSVGPLFGGTAAASALMKFSEEQIRHHFSYAAQQASGIQCWSRDTQHVEKAFDFGGMPARNAIAGATMVAAGFTAVADSFVGDNNFFTAFSSNPQPDQLWMGLGERYEILGATIKKWCVGSPVQGAIDAIVFLMENHDLTAQNVASVRIELPDDRCRLVDNRSMPNINVQHLVSLTLVDGGLNFSNSHDATRMSDPRVTAIRQCTTLHPNAELTTALPPRQVIISVKTKDGRELYHRTKAVRGTPDNPMSREEVVDKALDLVCPVLGNEQGRSLVTTVLALETVDDLVGTLHPLLKADKSQSLRQ